MVAVVVLAVGVVFAGRLGLALRLGLQVDLVVREIMVMLTIRVIIIYTVQLGSQLRLWGYSSIRVTVILELCRSQ